MWPGQQSSIDPKSNHSEKPHQRLQSMEALKNKSMVKEPSAGGALTVPATLLSVLERYNKNIFF